MSAPGCPSALNSINYDNQSYIQYESGREGVSAALRRRAERRAGSCQSLSFGIRTYAAWMV